MTSLTIRVLAWCAATVAAIVGLGGSSARVAVPLFILIGGGLEADNTKLLSALLTRQDTDKIVIVPYASGEPDVAASNATALFKAKRPGTRYVVLPDPSKDEASRQLAAEWIAHADLVYFTGGDQGRLTPRFLSDSGRPGPVLQALESGMLKHATPVAGTSAGAAAMADVMFTGGGSEDALTGEHGGVRLGPGLGMVPGVVIDTHTISRGRFGRMVAALESTGHRFAVGLAENRGVTVHGGLFAAIGDAAAVVIDAGEAKRDGLARRGLRLSLLSDGDAFNPNPAPGAHVPVVGAGVFGSRAPGVTSAPEVGALIAGDPSAGSPGAWDPGVLLTMIRRLAVEPTKPQVASSARFVVTLRADARTRWHMRPGEPGSLGVFDLDLEITPREP